MNYSPLEFPDDIIPWIVLSFSSRKDGMKNNQYTGIIRSPQMSRETEKWKRNKRIEDKLVYSKNFLPRLSRVLTFQRMKFWM